MEFTIICAVDESNGIGKDGDIPWRGSGYGNADMAFFRKTTTGHVVIMGRVTAESIPRKFWPLPDRVNIVLSSDTVQRDDGAIYMRTLDEALGWCAKNTPTQEVFICGGVGVYAEAVNHPMLRRLLITIIPGDYQCDKKFPIDINIDNMSCIINGSGISIYEKIYQNSEEQAYLSLLHSVINGDKRENRTSVPSYGTFGHMLRFTLGGKLPLLTTKKVMLKSVITELLWFLRGDTDIKYLHDNNVHIWDGNVSAEFLKGRGLEFPPGTVGAAYGHQWRHWGASVDNTGARTAPGYDQIVALIEGVRADPYSRRHVLTAWNPSQLLNVALPPCHVLAQMYVRDGALSCMVTMRSCDVFIGLPFNIASYSLLTYIIASICGLSTGELILSLGDCHIYESNIDAAKIQLQRTPRGFPTVNVTVGDIDSVSLSDINVKQYYPYPYIKSTMVA